MESCIFEGRVRHSRFKPIEHRFTYRLFYMYLDLQELPKVFENRWFWSTSRRALARFRREDHVGPHDEPLAESVRAVVAEETGKKPEGPIRLLTHLSYFGFCFNPVSFYFCFDAAGDCVETIVAEVSNTPWGERHCYVLTPEQPLAPEAAGRFAPRKTLHVSPFMPMDLDYDWSITAPGRRLNVYMANAANGERLFDASLMLERREIDTWSLGRVLMRYPFTTARVVLGIYRQALKLWIKRCPFYPHPSKRQPVSAKH